MNTRILRKLVPFGIKRLVPFGIKRLLSTYLIVRRDKCRVGFRCYVTRSNFHKTAVLGDDCHVVCSNVGRFTYITEGARVTNCKIGSFCSIGPRLRVGFGLHPTSHYVSTSPLFYSNDNPFGDIRFAKSNFQEHKFCDSGNKFFVEIGNDVWIGSDVKIMDGVVIGHGAIIGAGAVVTKSVPEYAIVAGVPAKTIRYRFSPREIEFLLSMKWWDQSDSSLSKYASAFNSIVRFMSAYDEG